MPRVFITGSTDGLGRASARALIDEGHEVVLHDLVSAPRRSTILLPARLVSSSATLPAPSRRDASRTR